MNKKKILNINANPELHSYSFLLNPLAILTSSDFVSDSLAKFKLRNYEQFTFESQKIKQRCEKDCLVLHANVYDTNLQCKYYKRYEENCCLDGTILYHQYTDAWATFGLFICDEPSITFSDISEIEGYYIGFTHEWGFIEVENHGINKINIPYDGKCFNYKIIQKEEKIIISLYSGDEPLVVREKTAMDYNTKYFGIYFNFFENRFYNWYYMNYIELHYHEALKEVRGCPVELLSLPLKKNNYYLMHPLLDYYCIPFVIFETLNIDIVEYVKRSIDKNCYVILSLNEYYVPVRRAYKLIPCYIHENMIYGYDESRQCVYLLGFNHGVPATGTVSYSDLRKAFIIADESNMISVKYSPDYYCVEFNIKTVYDELNNYLFSKDSTINYDMFMVRKSRLYGISIYDKILEPACFALFLEDVRISHILYEHNKHILNIIHFIYARGFLTEKQYVDIAKQFEEIVRECNILVFLVLKFQYKKTDKLRVSISLKLNKIKNKEIVSYQDLIKIISTIL